MTLTSIQATDLQVGLRKPSGTNLRLSDFNFVMIGGYVIGTVFILFHIFLHLYPQSFYFVFQHLCIFLLISGVLDSQKVFTSCARRDMPLNYYDKKNWAFLERQQ